MIKVDKFFIDLFLKFNKISPAVVTLFSPFVFYGIDYNTNPPLDAFLELFLSYNYHEDMSYYRNYIISLMPIQNNIVFRFDYFENVSPEIANFFYYLTTYLSFVESQLTIFHGILGDYFFPFGIDWWQFYFSSLYSSQTSYTFLYDMYKCSITMAFDFLHYKVCLDMTPTIPQGWHEMLVQLYYEVLQYNFHLNCLKLDLFYFLSPLVSFIFSQISIDPTWSIAFKFGIIYYCTVSWSFIHPVSAPHSLETRIGCNLGLFICMGYGFLLPLFAYWAYPIVPIESAFAPCFVDGLSFLFIWLTFLILGVCGVICAINYTHSMKPFFYTTMIVVLLLIAFTTTNIFWFYIAFEAVLIPTYLLIGGFGGQAERSYAGFLFFLYTLVGSITFIIALLLIHQTIGSFNFSDIITATTDQSVIGYQLQGVIWWLLVIGFAFKIPLFFVHNWLTVAHVEAPTVGSVLLASLLLKLGGYGLIRFAYQLFPVPAAHFSWCLAGICLLGFTAATFVAVRQLDLKRFIAYTSIAHMNFAILGLVTGTSVGYAGAVFTMISHGVIAGGLFALVGIIYDRFHVRNVFYFSGLADIMPVWSICFFLFMIANAGLPFLSGFPGEFLVIVSLFTRDISWAVFSIIGFIVTVVYAFLVLTRLLYGTPSFLKSVDITFLEISYIRGLLFFVILLGILPTAVLNTLNL